MLRYLLLIIGILCWGAVMGQSHWITGRVVDKADNSSMVGVYVFATSSTDTNKTTGTVTDTSGSFRLQVAQPGNYKLKVSYIGYKDLFKDVTVGNADMSLGLLSIGVDAVALKGATIEGQKTPVEQKDDTTQFNSSAFKTNKDATAEDLVTKMPGVTSDNGTVKVNGEQIQQVLVDGKPFFGDDPTLALKNLPAEVIDKVQVFDKQSDQSRFTGFDDGSSQKAMNIITKRGRSDGIFGRVYGGFGYGDDYRYQAGGNFNYFKGDRRISLLELSNDVNQQNFSQQDLLGVSASSGGGGGGRGGGGGGRGGGGGGGGAASNFLVGGSSGLATTHATGLNYSDMWGKKIKVTASYFFNYSDNITATTLTRNYITPAQKGLVYDETNQSETKNYNHRVNLRLEYTIDSSNALIFTPKVSFQKNDATSGLNGNNFLSDHFNESTTTNTTTADKKGYNFSSNLLYQHKFKKVGRTIAISVGNSATNNSGTNAQSATSVYRIDSTNLEQTTVLDQLANNHTSSVGTSGSVTYTEPTGKIGQIQLSYNPSYTKNLTDKETNNYDATRKEYALLDTALSNKYQNNYLTHNGGLAYRLNYKKMNLTVGVNYQYSMLTGHETYPTDYEVNRTFQSVLPMLRIDVKVSKTKNLRIFYRTNNSPPSISQLQNVINNSNPLLLSTGNPDLKQDYEQTLLVRYNVVNPTKSSNMFVVANANYYSNYIGNSVIIPVNDTILSDHTVIKRGSQLSRPVNLNSYASARSFFTYGQLISKIKCNVNINTGFTFSRTPGLVNNATNLADNYGISQGIVLSSNISEKIDFTVSYTANYTIARNSLEKQSNSNYFNHSASAKFNYQFWKGFVFSTSIINTYYKGLSATYDKSYFLWNLSIAYKFLKDESLELKASVYDVLKQNNSIARNTTDTYIEDSRTNVLTRYAMLTMTYTFRKFKNKGGAEPTPEEHDGPHGTWRGRPDGGGPSGGMPRGGGGPDGGGF